MTKTLDAKLAELSPEHQARITARANELIAEELTMQDLRRAMSFTQEQLARTLQVKQGTVSKLENRSDLLLSTLQDYVRSMGGELQLVAEFPDRPPVILKGFSSVSPSESAK